jgi:hypothetical protein
MKKSYRFGGGLPVYQGFPQFPRLGSSRQDTRPPQAGSQRKQYYFLQSAHAVFIFSYFFPNIFHRHKQQGRQNLYCLFSENNNFS